MSDIIRLLPDSIANQIAAGEVIQRPSSVIKELVENAIDAGATKIQIIVIEAGKDSIQVVDNGCGMSDTDARLAFERHATSKITEAADLFSLRTMGFRGEALASIAAVAQVELRTRQEGNDLGTSLIIEGGRVKEQTPITCPVGANFLVHNLFFNIPARRKFLKSNQTELNHILTEFERIVLAHPDVEFSLYSSDTLIQNLPISALKGRILNLFGRKMDASLIPLHVDTDIVHISGFTGTPQNAKKKGYHQFFFVNGRFMRHPYFNKAIQTAYDRLIPDGHQISYFIYFTIDPSQIDVNIHPQKTEIKFQDEAAIWPILLAAVRESLGKHDAVPTLDFDTANRPDIPTFTGDFTSLQPPKVHLNQDFNPFAPSSSKRQDTDTASTYVENQTSYANDYSFTHSHSPSTCSGYPEHEHASKRNATPQGWTDLYESLVTPHSAPTDIEASTLNTANAFLSTEKSTSTNLYDDLTSDEKQDWTKREIVSLQHHGHYIIASTEDGLRIIDQHRAHIRILYDAFRLQIEQQRGFTQGLLFPTLLQLSPSSAAILDSIIDELSNIGFDLSPLGGGAYSILGIPAGTEGLDPATLLQSLIDDAREGEAEVKEQIHHIIASSLARRAAIPVGQELGQAEMQDLVRRLYDTKNPNFTPDGATISVHLTDEKIERILG